MWHHFFSEGQLRAIRKVTFARIICDTVGGTQTIQPNPFLQPSVVGNRRKPCNQFPALDLSQWAENRVHADVSGKLTLYEKLRKHYSAYCGPLQLLYSFGVCENGK